MAGLKKVKELEERIAPSALGFADGLYRCGNGPNGEVDGYTGGHIDPQVDANGNVIAASNAPVDAPVGGKVDVGGIGKGK